MKRNTAMFVLTIINMLVSLSCLAQPGDRAFSFLTFDGYGYRCDFKVYSCTVKYPNSNLRSDSLELVWKPDLKTIRIVDTLESVVLNTNQKTLPYPCVYRGESCLKTQILMIVKDQKDTMFISTGGADPYALLLSPDHFDLGLPFVYPFQKGLFYLERMLKDRSAKSTFFVIHREYFLDYYGSHPEAIAKPSEPLISQMQMNKRAYAANDTLCVTLTGRVLNDGGCASGSILWTLLKFEEGKLQVTEENCCTQMDCGVGPSVLKNTTIPLILIKDRINRDQPSYPMQLELGQGRYRLVVYDELYRLYFSEEFSIE